MSAFPAVVSLREELDDELDGGISFTTTMLMTRTDPFSWLHAMMFSYHHEMEIDEAVVVEYIKRRVALVTVGSSGSCDLTAAVQCGVYSVPHISHWHARSSC